MFTIKIKQYGRFKNFLPAELLSRDAVFLERFEDSTRGGSNSSGFLLSTPSIILIEFKIWESVGVGKIFPGCFSCWIVVGTVGVRLEFSLPFPTSDTDAFCPDLFSSYSATVRVEPMPETFWIWVAPFSCGFVTACDVSRISLIPVVFKLVVELVVPLEVEVEVELTVELKRVVELLVELGVELEVEVEVELVMELEVELVIELLVEIEVELEVDLVVELVVEGVVVV